MIIGLGIGFVGLLAGLFGLGVVGLTIGIVVLFFVRKSRGEERPLVTFSVPLFIKTFLYIVLAAAIIITSSGLADLLNAAFSPLDGKKFSYMPKEVSASALSGPLGLLVQPKQEKPKADLNRELRRGLSDGVAKTVGAGLVAIILIMVLREMETDEQRRGGVLNRAFWVSLLAVFSVIAVASLTAGLAKLLGYYLPDADARVGPGGSLANAIVALLVWGYIIRRTLERLRVPQEA